MPYAQRAFFAALAALILAACGSRATTASENGAAAAEANALDNASPSEPGPANVSEEPADDPVPPPDAVSHPDGYLPNAADPPATAEPPDSGERRPATEDEYLRNR